MDDEVFRKLYGGAITIPGGTYPWQDDSVKTIGIMSTLMTLGFPPDSEDCAHVKTLSAAILDNIEWLISKGHDKWSEVSFNFPVAEANQSRCSSLYQ